MPPDIGATTATQAAVVALHDCVTELPCKTVVTVHELSVDDDTRSYTCAEGDHNEVLHSTGGTIGHFTYGCGIGIIGDCYRYAELLAYHLCERQRGRPWDVDKFLDHSCIIVGIRGTYTDTVNLLHGIICLQQTHDILIEFIYVVLHICMLECLY